MLFHDIPLFTGTATADPRSAPADVPSTNLLQVPRTLDNTSNRPKKMFFSLEAVDPGADPVTVNVQLAVMADSPNGAFKQSDSIKDGLAARRFYTHGAAFDVVTGVLLTSALEVPPGTLYVRVITGPAEAGILKVGFG